MIFNSFQFLIFFPILVSIYFLIPYKLRSYWLLVASYYFYMCWNYKYAFLMGFSTLITYISGLLLDKAQTIENSTKRKRYKKQCVFWSFFINLAILVFFKYWGFLADNINLVYGALHLKFSVLKFDFLLPVGISFYTFQALSYTVDVYRGDIYAEKNFFKYALFVSFFPQLVAGPIERSKNLLIQINKKHDFNYERIKSGLLLMLWGIFQKLVIADRVSLLVNTVYNDVANYEGLAITIATLLFAVQIYCDFSGYSDIAIGAARVMGFHLMDNFHSPYFSKSVAEFWRRWHISLSSWFRDYLYIPLGGSRCSKIRKYFNLMIVFLASGLWHGANWTFIIWGALNGMYQVIGDCTSKFRRRILKILKIKTDCYSWHLLQMSITFALIDFSWIFFRATSLEESVLLIKKMFTTFHVWQLFDGTLFQLGLDRLDFLVMVIAIIMLFTVDYWRRRGSIGAWLAKQNVVFRWAVYYCAIFTPIIFGIYGIGSAASQFIYFQF